MLDRLRARVRELDPDPDLAVKIDHRRRLTGITGSGPGTYGGVRERMTHRGWGRTVRTWEANGSWRLVFDLAEADGDDLQPWWHRGNTALHQF